MEGRGGMAGTLDDVGNVNDKAEVSGGGVAPVDVDDEIKDEVVEEEYEAEVRVGDGTGGGMA